MAEAYAPPYFGFLAVVTQGRGRSSGVERHLAKVDVVGSNPIARSICHQCTRQSIHPKLNTRRHTPVARPSRPIHSSNRVPKRHQSRRVWFNENVTDLAV